MPIVLIAAGVSLVVILVITIVVGLVCVKLRQTKKTDTRYYNTFDGKYTQLSNVYKNMSLSMNSRCEPTSGPKNDSDSPECGENDITSKPCLAYGLLDTEEGGENEVYYSYAS